MVRGSMLGVDIAKGCCGVNSCRCGTKNRNGNRGSGDCLLHSHRTERWRVAATQAFKAETPRRWHLRQVARTAGASRVTCPPLCIFSPRTRTFHCRVPVMSAAMAPAAQHPEPACAGLVPLPQLLDVLEYRPDTLIYSTRSELARR